MSVVAAMLAALAIAAASAGPASTSPGLRGVVMRGPISPVCIDAEPCERPAAGLVLRFGRGGVAVARARTGPRGAYEVRLPPGTYTVTTPHLRRAAKLTPRVARVRPGRVVRVDFHLDTGIQ